jgi:hypothetical protein
MSTYLTSDNHANILGDLGILSQGELMMAHTLTTPL